MMTKMRENLHIVLYALILLFLLTIFVQWGAGGTQVFSDDHLAGRIGDQKISIPQFEQIYRRQAQVYKQNTGQEISEDQTEMFRRQVWNQLVNEYVLTKELEKRGIALTDSELVYGTYNDPIPTLKSNKEFQENGEFSPQKLRNFISQNQGFGINLTNYYRSTYAQKAMQLFVDKASYISEAEVLEAYKEENLKAKVRFFGINKFRLKNSLFNVDDSEVKAYYDAHKDEFKVDEKRKIEYVRIDIKPSKEDTTLVLDELNDVKSKVLEGADFSEEVRYNSDDKAAVESNGEVDFFAKGKNSATFDEAIFAANVNDVIGPLADNNRYVLVKVLEKRKNPESKEDEVKIQQIVKYVTVGSTTANNFDFIAEEVRELAVSGSDIKTAAQERGIYYNETAYFTNNGFIPGIGRNMQLSQFVFNKAVGQVSREIRRNSNQTIYIARIKDVQASGYEEFEKVSSRVKNILINEKKGAKAKDVLASYKNQLSTATFKEVAENDTTGAALTEETELVKVYGAHLGKMGKSAELSNAIVNLETNKTSDVLETSVGAFVIQVLERTDIDMTAFESQKDELRKNLQDQNSYNQFNQWLTNAMKSYDIEEIRLF